MIGVSSGFAVRGRSVIDDVGERGHQAAKILAAMEAVLVEAKTPRATSAGRRRRRRSPMRSSRHSRMQTGFVPYCHGSGAVTEHHLIRIDQPCFDAAGIRHE